MQQNNYNDIIPEILYFVNRKCTPGWGITKDSIDFHDLTYVYSGRSVYLVNDTEYMLQQGDFVYIPSGNVRKAYTYPDEPMQCFAANFFLRTTECGRCDAALPFDTVLKAGISGELINLYSELDRVWVEKAYNYEMRATAIFMLILDRLLCSVATGKAIQYEDPRLLNVKQYILDNFMKKIELKKLAEIAGLNQVYLGACFKKAYGYTIKQYITRIRVNNAENLLSTGGYTVGEAAVRSGFDDLFYFSKVYRIYKGYAPSALIKVRNR